MSLFVEVDSLDKGCKVILNLEVVAEIAPLVTGGCNLFLSDGRVYRVKDSYDMFKQFAMQTVSAEDIAKRFPKVSSKVIKDLDIPKL